MLDGFSGRILSRLVVSVVQILPSRPGGSRWANPVGQIPLGKVRLMKPTAFTAASVIGISANALWGKSTWATATLRLRGAQCARSPVQYATMPRLRGAQSAASPSFVGPNPPRAPIPKRPGHFSTRATIRCGASAPKRQGRFSARHQSAQPVSTSRTKSTQAQNHQPKPPRESTEFISFFAQALWGLATTFSVGPHSTTSPSSSTRSLSASPDTSAKS